MTESLSRRRWLAMTTAFGVSASPGPRSGVRGDAAESVDGGAADGTNVGAVEAFVPMRTITRPPGHHWFGYYDKQQFSDDDSRVLGNVVAFEGRHPVDGDTIGVGYVDLADGDRWHGLGRSAAWGWQQGCMLQWIPGNRRRSRPSDGGAGGRVVYNDRDGDRFVSRIVEVGGEPNDGRSRHGQSRGTDRPTRTLPRPVYTLDPGGAFALTLNFSRLDNLRPGYGYAGLPDPNVAVRRPGDDGVFRMNLRTGASRLILSVERAAALPWHDGRDTSDAWHYFNHLLVDPTGSRFLVLHRYRERFDPSTRTFRGPFRTRALTGDVDGGNLHVLDPSGHTSHFIWDDPDHVTAWTRPLGRPRGFYRLTDRSDHIEPVGHDVMPANGHNTYLPSPHGHWILNDTYPARSDRRQTVYLVDTRRLGEPRSNGGRVDLARLPSPPTYTGPWRCDTHPRSNNAGTQVCVDSPHRNGRQMYLLDIADVVSGNG